MTQDACQFSGAVNVGYGRAIPACFIGKRVISLPGAPSPTPSNSAGRNAFAISSSTGTNALPIPGVARKHPQSAYAGLQKSLQQEWAFVQHVNPGIGNAFGPVE